MGRETLKKGLWVSFTKRSAGSFGQCVVECCSKLCWTWSCFPSDQNQILLYSFCLQWDRQLSTKRQRPSQSFYLLFVPWYSSSSLFSYNGTASRPVTEGGVQQLVTQSCMWDCGQMAEIGGQQRRDFARSLLNELLHKLPDYYSGCVCPAHTGSLACFSRAEVVVPW